MCSMKFCFYNLFFLITKYLPSVKELRKSGLSNCKRLSPFLILTMFFLFHFSANSIEGESVQILPLDQLTTELKKNKCTDSHISSVTDVVLNNNLDIRDKGEMLLSFFTACKNHRNFMEKMAFLAMQEEIHWYIKEKILLFYLNNTDACSHQITEHLLNFFLAPTTNHIRNSIIWILSKTKKNCDREVISFFSDFIQKDSSGLMLELSDFRQYNIQSILYALVYIAIKNQNPLVFSELKMIAMNHNINVYFRVRAVESLQDLSIYFQLPAQILYTIIKHKRQIAQSNFINWEERKIRDQNREVSDSAFNVLMELVETDPFKFFSFLLNSNESRNFDHFYRRKVFSSDQLRLPDTLDQLRLPDTLDQLRLPGTYTLSGQLRLPGTLDHYARPILEKLSKDPGVDQRYRKTAGSLFADE